MPVVRIVNLGDILMQNQPKAVRAFAERVSPTDTAWGVDAIGTILLANQLLLEQFKLGDVTEEAFACAMIAKIREATSEALSVDEFYAAWNTMNPSYTEFALLLESVVREHSDAQHIFFVSHTNPIDMHHLTKQLDAHGIAYTRDPSTGELNGIHGIPLRTTYTEKKSKACLIQDVVAESRAAVRPPAVEPLHGYSFFGIEDVEKVPAPPVDIKYIRGITTIDDPLLRSLSEASATAVAATTESIGIETIFWNTKEQPFGTTIHCPTVYAAPATRL